MTYAYGWLEGELGRIRGDKIKQPEDRLQNEDTLVGTIEDIRTKKVYDLIRLLVQRADNVRRKHNQIIKKSGTRKCTAPACKLCELCQRHDELIKQKVVAERVLWTSVRSELLEDTPTADHDFAIREGWQVVLLPKQEGTPKVFLL